jgi:hypothetical protein
MVKVFFSTVKAGLIYGPVRMSTEKYGSERFHTMQTVKVYDTCTVRVRIDPVRDGKNTISTLTARFNKQPCETLEVPSKTVQQPYASVYICSCTVDATGPLRTDNTVYAGCMQGVCAAYARHESRWRSIPGLVENFCSWSKIFLPIPVCPVLYTDTPVSTRCLPVIHGNTRKLRPHSTVFITVLCVTDFFQSRFAPSYTRILPFQHGVYRLYTVIPGNCVRTQPCL